MVSLITLRALVSSGGSFGLGGYMFLSEETISAREDEGCISWGQRAYAQCAGRAVGQTPSRGPSKKMSICQSHHWGGRCFFFFLEKKSNKQTGSVHENSLVLRGVGKDRQDVPRVNLS
jgi:hypothetical protein